MSFFLCVFVQARAGRGPAPGQPRPQGREVKAEKKKKKADEDEAIRAGGHGYDEEDHGCLHRIRRKLGITNMFITLPASSHVAYVHVAAHQRATDRILWPRSKSVSPSPFTSAYTILDKFLAASLITSRHQGNTIGNPSTLTSSDFGWVIRICR